MKLLELRKVAGRYLLQNCWANGQPIWKRMGHGEELWMYSGTSGSVGCRSGTIGTWGWKGPGEKKMVKGGFWGIFVCMLLVMILC